jgi:hypothetical protein
MNYSTALPIIPHSHFSDHETYTLYCILDRSIFKNERENTERFLLANLYAPQELKEFYSNTERYLTDVLRFLKPYIKQQTEFERAFEATGQRPYLPTETHWAFSVQISSIANEYKELRAYIRLALILAAANAAGYLRPDTHFELVDIADSEEEEN